jgi:hypothetical protein
MRVDRFYRLLLLLAIGVEEICSWLTSTTTTILQPNNLSVVTCSKRQEKSTIYNGFIPRRHQVEVDDTSLLAMMLWKGKKYNHVMEINLITLQIVLLSIRKIEIHIEQNQALNVLYCCCRQTMKQKWTFH